MTSHRRHFAQALVVAALALGTLGVSQAQAPAPKTAPPAAPAAAPAAGPDMKRLASEAWVYAFPLVLTDVTRETQSAGLAPNTFKHRRTTPDASSTDVANPNPDFLYSNAWLDLSKGPVLLSVPDTKGR